MGTLHLLPLLLSFGLTIGSFTTRDAAVDILLRVKINQLTDPDSLLTNWIDSTNPCNYTAITCNNQTNDIISIDFSDFETLSGPFPADFCRIQTLRQLSIGNNYFKGSISPSSFSLCSHLTFLNISSNYFTGKLPEFQPGFFNLTVLDVSYNTFNGEIPASIGELLLLQFIDFSSNYFSADIPESLTNLTELTTFLAHWPVISLNPLLVQLKLFNNSFSGSLPESLGKYSELEEFDVLVISFQVRYRCLVEIVRLYIMFVYRTMNYLARFLLVFGAHLNLNLLILVRIDSMV